MSNQTEEQRVCPQCGGVARGNLMIHTSMDCPAVNPAEKFGDRKVQCRRCGREKWSGETCECERKCEHQERIADFADKWLMFKNPPCPWCEIERLTSELASAKELIAHVIWDDPIVAERDRLRTALERIVHGAGIEHSKAMPSPIEIARDALRGQP